MKYRIACCLAAALLMMPPLAAQAAPEPADSAYTELRTEEAAAQTETVPTAAPGETEDSSSPVQRGVTILFTAAAAALTVTGGVLLNKLFHDKQYASVRKKNRP